MSETRKFTEDILTAAKGKAQIIINEAETETQRALDEAKAHSTREAEDLLSNARAEAEGVRRRTISEVRHRLKLQEQLEKSKILTDALEQTKTRVRDIVKEQNRYYAYLASLVTSGAREIGLDAVVVHLNSSDLKRIDIVKFEREIAKSLEKSIKIEFSKEPIEALGGAIVSSKDGRTRIVNTLDQRIEALEPRLLIEAGKILFGE
jgi:V/A-type H+-transporting ATPase subunit E